ncbi:5'-methylthioadenosine/S-adenosylhomocysteine nucleosidase [Oceanobacillus neutriphilus]|uniref:5'-methylthioadenosine/S-adenosylhomocysteine nucleosidase n=1 Tax=Oceanobacillus neutriphilus TaxID=531815 RepID=A0ABQ2NYK2_9BACI|nr:5'-methylthioadenosine/S-adenosylhomocysteine nucleosidase [Oceanobacillus neutriphilus]GGP13736.1 5'-methylthioadenosine/S-adenosylhomocysteine nucleosidase [Oceanobacillus neutriphilus]
MTIGIIGAMDEEIELLKQKMTDIQEIKIANSYFYQGYLEGKQVVLLLSGIGKVNAAMSATILHERFNPDKIINTGSAGGFADNLDVGDVVISTEVLHHDVDATAFNYAYGQVPGMPASYTASPELIKLAGGVVQESDIQAEFGIIATGDSFMQREDQIAVVRERFPEMLALEMEAAAIAQVCYQYKTQFVIIRALSDIAGKESSVSFDVFLEKAAKNAADVIIKMVRNL